MERENELGRPGPGVPKREVKEWYLSAQNQGLIPRSNPSQATWPFRQLRGQEWVPLERVVNIFKEELPKIERGKEFLEKTAQAGFFEALRSGLSEVSAPEKVEEKPEKPPFLLKELAERALGTVVEVHTDLSSAWNRKQEERKSKKWESSLALVEGRRMRLAELMEVFGGEFGEAVKSLEVKLPPRGTPEYDEGFLLFVREKMARIATIDSLGEAAERVGRHLADLKEERGRATVDKNELPSLISEVDEVLPLRIERNFQKAREWVGRKLALVAGGLVPIPELGVKWLVRVIEVTLPVSSGAAVGSAFALAKGIIIWKTIGIHSVVGAGLSLVCYAAWLRWRKGTEARG